MAKFKLNFDGGAQPNPGNCAGAFVLYKNDELVSSGGKYVEYGTNNQGEYTGLIIGLEKCSEMIDKGDQLIIEGDSMLIIKQISGEWKVKNEKLFELYLVAKNFLTLIKCVPTFKHVLRKYNKEADFLSNLVINKKNF